MDERLSLRSLVPDTAVTRILESPGSGDRHKIGQARTNNDGAG
jgi:hypothetical protein